jgi:hypothetical protein
VVSPPRERTVEVVLLGDGLYGLCEWRLRLILYYSSTVVDELVRVEIVSIR